MWAVFGILDFCQASKNQGVDTAKEHEWRKYFLEQTFALWRVKSRRLSSICAVGAFGDTCRRQLLALSTVERVYVRFLDGRKMLPDRKVTHSPGVWDWLWTLVRIGQASQSLPNGIISRDTHSVFVRQTFVSAGMWTQHKWSYTHAVAVRQSCLWNADTAQLFMIVLIDHECLGNFVTGAAVMQWRQRNAVYFEVRLAYQQTCQEESRVYCDGWSSVFTLTSWTISGAEKTNGCGHVFRK